MESENPARENDPLPKHADAGPDAERPVAGSEEKVSPRRFSVFVYIVVLVAALVLVFSAYLAYLTVSLPSVAHLHTQNPTESSLMRQRAREAKIADRPYRIRHRWRSFDAIPDGLVVAVLVGEDANFYGHDGFDFYEIREAIKKAWDGRRLRGASTITQQLAKNLFLSTERSYDRKLREALLARRLEAALNKKRILELYLNVIEWGDGVYGIEAASHHYFRKGPGALTIKESVQLAARIPKPRDASPEFVDRGAARILRWMVRAGHLTQAEYERARN